ncbi:glutamate ligase domain-containing protein [Streptomyces sp. NPDC002623]
MGAAVHLLVPVQHVPLQFARVDRAEERHCGRAGVRRFADNDMRQALDGVARRVPPAGEATGVLVFDSYAHHPDEVSADLAAARSLVDADGRVIAVFQPSDQRRLDAFHVEFGKALADCDQVVLTGGMRGVTSASLALLATHVNRAGGSAEHVLRDQDAAVAQAARVAESGDVVG